MSYRSVGIEVQRARFEDEKATLEQAAKDLERQINWAERFNTGRRHFWRHIMFNEEDANFGNNYISAQLDSALTGLGFKKERLFEDKTSGYLNIWVYVRDTTRGTQVLADQNLDGTPISTYRPHLYQIPVEQNINEWYKLYKSVVDWSRPSICENPKTITLATGPEALCYIAKDTSFDEFAKIHGFGQIKVRK